MAVEKVLRRVTKSVVRLPIQDLEYAAVLKKVMTQLESFKVESKTRRDEGHS